MSHPILTILAYYYTENNNKKVKISNCWYMFGFFSLSFALNADFFVCTGVKPYLPWECLRIIDTHFHLGLIWLLLVILFADILKMDFLRQTQNVCGFAWFYYIDCFNSKLEKVSIIASQLISKSWTLHFDL